MASNLMRPTEILAMASNLMPPTELLVMASNLIDGLQPNY